MATRSLRTLDYVNYQTNNILKKHARNRPLGDIEHRLSYVPCQPVLSCRTVDIDLPGTRTYRPKNTIDILDEQQRLIRLLYTKHRASASAPPRQRRQPSSQPKTETIRANIAVQGRPLTSSSSQSRYQNENIEPEPLKRRPKTTGRLKNVTPATDCFMVVKVDPDLLETSRNSKDLTNQIRDHWKSENSNLAQGKFVRGAKRPDDVPPSLDAWLTFGGAAGDNGQGVIDAFASFKNSEEFYNIDGSVGSRVAQQLRKGDKIRIGINGVLQSQDLKVRKRTKDRSTEKKTEDHLPAAPEPSTLISVDDTSGVVDEAVGTDGQDGPDGHKDEAKRDDPMGFDFGTETADLDYDDCFKALDFDGLDDLLEDSMEEEENSPKPNFKKMKKKEDVPERPADPEKHLKMTIPLSWNDQCNKIDIKMLQAKMAHEETKKPVLSETHPVRYDKLSNGETRPRLAQPRPGSYKVKQRSLNAQQERPGSSSKVKVVYIDPLSNEEDDKVNSITVDDIIHGHIASGSREGTATPQRGLKENEENGVVTFNDIADVRSRPSRQLSAKSNRSRQSRPGSSFSQHSDKSGGGYPTPKLKVVPTHSSIHQSADGMGIIISGAKDEPPMNEMPRTAKTPGRASPAKPLHRIGSGQGGSIKAGPMPGDAEYIKITTSLRMTNSGGTPIPGHINGKVAGFNGYNFSPRSNTPRDPDYQRDVYHNNRLDYDSPHQNGTNILALDSNGNMTELVVSSTGVRQSTPTGKLATDTKEEKGEEQEMYAQSGTSDSPAPTTVAISIPTADELSDKESPDPSPSRRKNDGLTQKQRRERDMRNAQIDQLTNLIGDAIVDS